MNRTDAKKIAAVITVDQVATMFENAKEGTTDWSSISKVNAALTKGYVWNMLYPLVNKKVLPVQVIVCNMIVAFGDFLPEDLKIKKKPKAKYDGPVLHEDPKF
jgi:hypothetical protein